MKILIIEDESAAVTNLLRLLQRHLPEAEVVGTLESVAGAVKWFRSNPQPDLVLMDIELTDGRSFEILQQVQVEADVIFTTAYDEYVLNAFDFNSVDYLLKPIREEKFAQAVLKFRQRHIRQLSFEKLAHILKGAEAADSPYKKRFLVKKGNKLLSIKQEQISYFYRDEYVFLVTRKGAKFPVNQSLEELETIVDPAAFFRLNRKYVAHIEAISDVESYDKSRLRIELRPSNNESIIISQEKSRLLKIWMENAS
ncbi:LytR/AlgR family response regulator transcription factor [Nafulsella turpanensis]|uniref:LytR/AlgR family response regulator transcription factor n=1 Tax=Nafulsella turpanensis TaxID=1265690 RepID=UPI00034C04D5|nr:LytTR family DNA-binding domain-containing protein [Nafulsella turpanensis]